MGKHYRAPLCQLDRVSVCCHHHGSVGRRVSQLTRTSRTAACRDGDLEAGIRRPEERDPGVRIRD